VIRTLRHRVSTVQRRQTVLYWLLLVLPLPLAIYALGLGRFDVQPHEVIRTLLDHALYQIGPVDYEVWPQDIIRGGYAYQAAPPDLTFEPDIIHKIVIRVRMPRILASLLIGANLSVTGAAFQGIFRNPLVDSNILGVTSGAGFGAALMLLINAQPVLVQASAFTFGLIAVMLAYAISRLYHSAPLLVLTLVGILIGSFFGSLTSLLKYVADPLDSLPAITYWLLGGLTGVTREDIPALFAVSALGAAFMWGVRWRLNVLSLGDGEALALGLNPTRLKLLIILSSTLMTAMAVSVGGVIGWVGLVIPHAVRTLVGPDHQRLIPASTAMGASFLLMIDTLSRTLWANEIPLGVFTGIVGVPLLLIILRVNKTGWR
jgi:iron complex transport system permease protein